MLVLQHCRGDEQIDIDSGSSSDPEFEADGALPEYSHRMVSNTNLTYIQALNIYSGYGNIIF